MDKCELAPGMVVQISPESKNKMFAGCFLVVTEPKSFGCQGFVQALGENGEIGGQAYLRPCFEDIEFVGQAQWIIKE